MSIQNNSRTIALVVLLLIGVAVTAVMPIQLINAPQNLPDDVVIPPTLNVTLLTNAGIMIETNETRIYIDPYLLNSTFADYPADIVLVTHPHLDHYDTDSLDIIVDYDPSDDLANVNLPPELVYVIIGGIAVVVIIVVLFLKKSKEPMEDEEEPWEDYEDI